MGHEQWDAGAGRVDDQGFEQFMAAHYRGLVGALTLICGDRTLAEEATQEAMLRLWRSPDHGSGIRTAEAWVRVVAVNYLRNHARRLGRERRALLRLAEHMESQVSKGTAGSDWDIDLVRQLSGLPRRQREVVVLHYRFGMSVAQTAETLGLAAGTVKTLLFRSRLRLQALLATDAAASDPTAKGDADG